MPRRSERLLEKKMSDVEEEICAKNNSAESLDNGSENEMTIVEQPTTAELKKEILQLRESLNTLMEKCRNTTATLPAVANTQQIYTTATLPAVANCQIHPLSTLPAVDNCHINTSPMLPASMPPMQQQYNLSEYKMPYTYYLPNTAAQQRVQTTISIPLLSSHSTTFAHTQPTQMFTNTTTRMPPNVSCSNLPSPSQTISLSASAPQTVERQAYRELRKLHDLPEFSGQPEQWPMFSVAFNETTRIYNYTNLENLMRLQKALKGEAKLKVETFLIHPDSVCQVMSTLQFHYGRPQVLIRSQIAKVRAFPQI